MRSRKMQLLFAVLLLFVALPAVAAEEGDGGGVSGVNWEIISASAAIAIAAAFGALSQSRAITAAVSALARNPGAAGDIRFALILGLALIESLVIYALVIALRGAAFF